jgi:zinc/manganese transport system permease protein
MIALQAAQALALAGSPLRPAGQAATFLRGPGWNPVAGIATMLSFAFMRNAYLAGTASAVTAGLVGYFVVLRGSSFAAHAVSHIGFAGAAGALLLGINPIFGVGALSLAASAGMGLLGKRLRGRDAVIGLVMAFSLGLGVLFITLYQGNASNALAYLFGQIFGISAGGALLTVAASAAVLAALAVMYRPLLFASLDEEVAQARGVPAGPLSVAFMLVMALAVTEAVQVSGALLIFSLLIAPGAVAERVTRRPAAALALSAALATAITWVSLALAFYTPCPVSFYVPALAFTAYLATRLLTARRGMRARDCSPPGGDRTAARPAATVRM